MTESTTERVLQQPVRPVRKIQGDSALQVAWRRFRRHRIAIFGAAVIVLMMLIAVFAPWLTPYDPAKPNLTQIRRGISFQVPPDAPLLRNCVKPQAHIWKCGAHPFGTDEIGRDVLTRVMFGARVSLTVGFIAAIVGTLLGTFLGAIAGFFGGILDSAISRFVEIMLSIPQLPLLLILVGLLSNPNLALTQYLKGTLGSSQSIVIIIVVIISLSWMAIARLVRGEVLSLREHEFVDAARALGFTKARIIFRHLFPNVAHVVIVQTTLQVGEAILIESGLSFLGLGIQPPAVSWGNMLALAQGYLYYENGIYVALFPGIFIIITVLTFNFLGDGLRDALDPRAVR